MGYKLRSFPPGGATHLTARGVADEPIFRGDLDRHAFLTILRRISERVQWTVVAWCLMDTHYHLLVVTAADPQVPRALQTLNSVYAREFNRWHGRRGHLFGARYRDTPIRDDAHLEAARAYVLRNPVEAGMARRVEDWRWAGDHRLEPRGAATQRSRNVKSSAATTRKPSTIRAVPTAPPAPAPIASSTPATR
jgi:putative transposase